MTIDASKPTGTDLVSSLANYIQADREQINLLWAAIASSGGGAGQIIYNAENMVSGQTTLVTGTNLTNVINEIVYLTANAAVNLMNMSLGLAGTIKTIIAGDDNVTIVQNKSSVTGGTFSLNSPAGVDLEMQTGDVLTVVNISGDGTLVHGYWRELYRTLRV